MTRHKTADTERFAKMIGGNLRFLRLNRATFMPQKVVADHLGITHQQINKYENGLNVPCSYRLVQLSDFFKVKCDDLVNPSYIHDMTKSNQVLERHWQYENINKGGTNGNL